MADPNIGEVQATTDLLWNVKVEDTIFKNDPCSKMFLEIARKPYTGGRSIQNPLAYNKSIGGWIAGGETLNVDIVDMIAAAQFRMGLAEDNITEELRTIEGWNRGGAKMVDIIDTKLEIAGKTLSERIAIAMHHHAQASGTGVADERSLYMNGWAEALTDGVSYSWDGNYYPTYGGLTRSGAIGSALNSPPFFMGNSSSGAAGAIGFSQLLDSQALAEVQGGMIKFGFTSIRGYNLIQEKFQNQQRIENDENPVIGFRGMKIGNATLFKSPYFPSSAYGVNDANTGNYLPSDITIAVTTPSTASRQPSSGTIKVGEVGIWIDPDTWDFYVSDSKVLGFGNTGWKVGNNHLLYSIQFLAEVTLLCRNPRWNNQFFGFNS